MSRVNFSKHPHGIPGRLAHSTNNWETITKDQWVLDMVRGYEIDFTAMPFTCKLRKLNSLHYSTEQISLLKQEVGDLLQKGAISQLQEEQGEAGFYSWYPEKMVG